MPGGTPRGVRGADLVQGDCRFGLEDTSRGTPTCPPRLIIGPRLRQVEPRGDRQAGGLVGDRQADQDLAVVDLAHLAAVLAGHADECLPFLGMPVSSTIQKRTARALIAGST